MKSLFVAIGFMLVGSAIAFGQNFGTVNGRVVDPAGAVVAGAQVTITNVGTGATRNSITNSDGLYAFPALDAATYDLKVEMAGFAPTTRQGLTLVTGSTLTIDLNLAVAGSSQTVTVSGEALLVETTTSEVAASIRTNEVQSLPILNRNFAGLVTLTPGARPTTTASSNKIAFGGGIGVAGGTGRNVELEVDGVATRDNLVGGTLFNMTIESVQEFKVIAHDFGAPYGRTSGGVVLIASKSGTNAIHGSAFAFGRNDSMTAIDYFSKQSGFPNPPYDREQFGGSVGGPVIKDKLFYFGAIERIQQNSVIAYPKVAFNEVTILKNSLIGLGNLCPACVAIGNSIVPVQSSPQTVRDLMYTLKGDYQVNSKHSLFLRFAQQRVNNFNTLIQGPGSPPHPDADPNGSNEYDKPTAFSAVLSHTWLLSGSTVNTVGVQGSHLYTAQFCKCDGTPGPQWPLRNMQFGQTIQVGVSQNNTDQYFQQDVVQFKDDFAHQVGRHALRVGGDFSFFPDMELILAGAGGLSNGAITWFDNPSTIAGNLNKYPQGFLTRGAVSRITVGDLMLGGAPGVAKILGPKQFGAYFQDDWKILPRFTLNLGIRYDLDVNWYNQQQYANNRIYLALKAINSPYAGLPDTPKKDFSPRIGFAWDVSANGKDVVRGSAGMYFDQMIFVNQTFANLLEQPNLANLAASFSNTAVGAGTQGIQTYRYGIDSLPQGPTPGLTQLRPGAQTTGWWLNPHLKDPRNYQFHLGYSRQIQQNTTVTADYTWIQGLHDFRNININPVEGAWDPNAASYTGCILPPGTPPRRLACALQNVLGDPKLIGQLNISSSDNRSRYKEFSVLVQHRSKRLSLQASYTLSYAYAYGGAISGANGGPGAVMARNPDLWFGPGEWGPSLTDERHRVVTSAVIELPWKLQVSPIFQIASARPYNPIAGADLVGAGQGNIDRAIDPTTGQQYSVNGVRGTATWDLDTRISRTFNLHSERLKIAFFAELYNITNKANFGNNYFGIASIPFTYGQPSGFLNNGFSLPTSRQLQLGARISF